MPREREHIEWLNRTDVVVLRKRSEVSRQRDRITGDVDNSLRSDDGKRPEELLVCPCACRVHYHRVEVNSLLGALPEVLPGVAAVERDVPGKPVELAVLYCVAHRRGVVFYPLNGLNAVRGDYPYRAGAAVRVQERVRFLQRSGIHRVGIQPFRLLRIHLIEGLRRDPEALSAYLVNDVAVAVQCFGVIPQREEFRAAVDRVRHGPYCRELFHDGGGEIPLLREHRHRPDDIHEYLPGVPADAHQDVLHESSVRAGIPRAYPERAHQSADPHDDLVCPGVVYHAAVDPDDTVPGGLIHPRDDIPVPVAAEYRLYLAAVASRVLHGDYPRHLAVFSQEPVQVLHLPVQLLFVGQVGQLTAAAFPGNGTYFF